MTAILLLLAAPLPFDYAAAAPWLPDPVGRYEHRWTDQWTGKRMAVEFIVCEDGTAVYRGRLLKWHLERGDLLFTEDGITRYWICRKLRVRRLK